jgi:hypothetical protein
MRGTQLKSARIRLACSPLAENPSAWFSSAHLLRIFGFGSAGKQTRAALIGCQRIFQRQLARSMSATIRSSSAMATRNRAFAV